MSHLALIPTVATHHLHLQRALHRNHVPQSTNILPPPTRPQSTSLRPLTTPPGTPLRPLARPPLPRLSTTLRPQQRSVTPNPSAPTPTVALKPPTGGCVSQSKLR